ncbi:hypothetical protein [Paenarthrobacter sp. AB444]|uniref:hypothetical protein n=1 Tax=Paenarthrobacter sp. AB444 TaxID=3025681 RepID=UPI0023658A45|nr:hypothetical protein [Paenarthrobacter sp. AB444]MDD7834995.1 hypothetical protein [Paenarthrobacter sp. AB444]
MERYNITEIVKAAKRRTKLPENFDDLDETTKERIRRQAQADEMTPEALYEVIKARRARDLDPNGNGFDPDAIAKAALAR